MQVSVDYLNSELNNDFKSLIDRKTALEMRPDVAEYLDLLEDIKAMKGQIGDDMLALYRAHGIKSIQGDIATAYIKDDYEIQRDRLTPGQVVAMFDYNPAAFKVTDKAIRDTILIAKKAQSNGDCSDGVQAILGLDLDRLRGPVKHSAVVRTGGL